MKTFLVFICLGLAPTIFSQTRPDRIYLCKYKFTYQKDSANITKSNDLMVLDIGKNYARYYSEIRQVGNKRVAEEIKKNSSGNVINLGEVSNLNDNHYDKESEIIINYYHENKQKIIDAFGRTPTFYNDTLLTPAWDIKEDTLTILTQLCQKAICSFKGRNYSAWFAPTIPIQLGPWQFSGLPGLILKIQDDMNQFEWQCIELTPKPNEEPVYNEPENITMTTKTKMRERKKMFLTEPLAFDQLEWGVTMSYNNKPVQPKKPKPYNPIDLTY
jgi:GLPGLI family protein